jgi:hypothetical protein
MKRGKECIGPGRNFPVWAGITGLGEPVGIVGGVVGCDDYHQMILALACGETFVLVAGYGGVDEHANFFTCAFLCFLF